MQLKTILNHVQKFKSFVCTAVRWVEHAHQPALEVEMRSKIGPMKKVARMLRSHRELLMNWFRSKGRLSSGVVEGFNAKAKLTSRKALAVS